MQSKALNSIKNLQKNISLFQQINFWPFAISAVLSLLYIVFFPKNLLGFIISLLSLSIILISLNKICLGFFLIFWGGAIFGNILAALQISYLGYPLFTSIGIFILFLSKKEIIKVKAKWNWPISWLLVSIIVILLSFLYGPMTKYSWDKLLQFVVKTLVAIVAIKYIIISKRSIMWQLGCTFILSSLVLYSTQVYLYPEFSPKSIFVIGGLKFSSFSLTLLGSDFRFATNEIALIASIGLSFLFVTVEVYNSRYYKILTLIYLLIALIIVGSAGQRLFYFIPLISYLATLIVTKKFSKFYNPIVLSILSVFTVFIIKMYRVLFFYENFAEFLNRGINWDSALQLIKEKPFFGFGLGGYFIKSYSYPGDVVYPHNLILELLTETGLIGTAIIIGYVLIFFILPRFKQFIFFRTFSGESIFPFFITVFTFSQLSFDLRITYLLFSIITSIWAYIFTFSTAKNNRFIK